MVFGPDCGYLYNLFNSVSSLNSGFPSPTLAKTNRLHYAVERNPAIHAEPRTSRRQVSDHVVFPQRDSRTTDNFQRYRRPPRPTAWGGGAGKSFQGGVCEAVTMAARRQRSVKQEQSRSDSALHRVAARPGAAPDHGQHRVTSAGGESHITIDSVGQTIAGA